MKHIEGPAKSELAFRNRHRTQRIGFALLRRIARAALGEPPLAVAPSVVPHHALCVVLVGDAEMTELNRRWLGQEGATDVIAFGHGGPGAAAERAGSLCGDVVISLDTARRAARRFRTSWQAEVVRYLVHGFLHLRGFDDKTPSARRQMKRAESTLLKILSRRFDFRGLGSMDGG